jgi:hypothetical protein
MAQAKKYEALDKLLRQATQRQSNKDQLVPPKKKSKPVGYKMQDTFAKNLQGLPGGTRLGSGSAIAIRKMVDAPTTGAVVRKESIGVLRSARNCNTTSGNYTRSIVTDETGEVVSDAQGRKKFGL